MEGAPADPTRTVRMISCAAGIMLAFVLYGLLQERIMTQPYGPDDEMFKSSAFLVLSNRIVAICIAVGIMLYKGEPLKNSAPILTCSGPSLSNTLATFCQYEALKYVSFPTQTLGKCGKMIPVMILGLLFLAKKHTWKDFLIAFLVTVGCAAFVLTGEITDARGMDKSDSVYGLALMGGYLLFDGFTSVLQEKLFRGYKMSTYNQMLYVNTCSATISLIMLVISGELWAALSFCFKYPEFNASSLGLSVCAAGGQLVIYYTIKEFGALFFSTVMTVRQVVSIVLSCIIYLHPLTAGQWLSAILVFGALYYKEAWMKKEGHGHGHGQAAKPQPVDDKAAVVTIEKPPQ